MSRTYKHSDENRKLRNALGQFPTGVAIVTALDDELQPVGMTINSFSSISLAPALISWCIDHRAASHGAFTNARNFTITVLSEYQENLAIRFATRGADKFRDIHTDSNDAPIIPNGCAWFKCQAYRPIALGDHTMLVGTIIEFARYSVPALVYRDGQFQRLVADTEATTQAAA